MDSEKEQRKGVFFALAAYVWWGLFPIYFHLMDGVPALEILSHRIFQSALFLVILVMFLGRLGEVGVVIRNPRTLRYLIGTTLLISMNWFVYIYAVQTERILHASLGYYINPLVNVMLGFLFLGERLRKLQLFAFVLAMIGVLVQGLNTVSEFPWISIVLALCFGFYGLLRKRLGADAIIGLTVETLLLAPMALLYLVYMGSRGTGTFFSGTGANMVLLLIAGVLTSLPLIWFAAGARRLTLTTIGFLQYINPTIKFVIAIFLFGEVFTALHGVTFGFIWTALTIYSIDAIRHTKQRRRDLEFSRAKNTLPSNVGISSRQQESG